MGVRSAAFAVASLGLLWALTAGAEPPWDALSDPPAAIGPWDSLDAFAPGVLDLSRIPLGNLVSPAERARRAFAKTHPFADRVFQVGEHLVFSVRYGPIRAGEATMSIQGIEVVDGDSCYHIVTTAKSNDFFSTFFHVRDRVESYMDTALLLPRRFEKHLLEGKYSNNTVVEMDQRNHLAIYEDGRIVEMLPGSQDVLSAFYVVRTRRLHPGEEFDMESHVDRKNYPIRVKVWRRERVKVPYGEFDCLVVEPQMRSLGLFKHKGRLTIWLTDDCYRIPIQVKSELPIGAISVVLVDVQGRADRLRD